MIFEGRDREKLNTAHKNSPARLVTGILKFITPSHGPMVPISNREFQNVRGNNRESRADPGMRRFLLRRRRAADSIAARRMDHVFDNGYVRRGDQKTVPIIIRFDQYVLCSVYCWKEQK